MDVRAPHRTRAVRDFLLGLIEIHVLHHATEEPLYGVAIMDLAASRYLRRLDRVVDGRVRKYHVATPAGRRALAAVKTQIRELVDEVLAPARRPRPGAPRRPRRGERP